MLAIFNTPLQDWDMIIKSAEMNRDGVDMLLALAGSPQMLEEDFKPDFDQLYFPGITVPSVKKLKKPFNVPIFGDNESIGLSIDYPRKNGAQFYKRIGFVGMLAAEDITIGWPLTAPSDKMVEELFWLDDLSPEHYDEKTDDAYDKYTGDWGGFLHATASFHVTTVSETGEPMFEVATSAAEFVVMEDESDFDTVHRLLESGSASAPEIVSAIRMPRLGKLLLS